MRHMLDTDICIYVINERPPSVLQAFVRHESAGLGVSAVTGAELFYGVTRTGSQRNLQGLRQFLAPLEIAPFDAAAAEVFGSLRAWLQTQRPSAPMKRRLPPTPTNSASPWSATTCESSSACPA